MKKTILNFLFIVTIILCVFVYSAYTIQKPLMENFHKYFHSSFEIPGLEDGFVPQGITYVKNENVFLLSGYVDKEESASCIYILDHGEHKKIELYIDKETPYSGHCGGIASYNNTIWLANDGEGKENCIWFISLDELMNTSKLYLKESFQSEVQASTCDVHDGYLWVGEYEDGMNYYTDKSHHLTKNNPSLIVAYEIDETKPYGITSTTPQKALSVRNRLQGIEFDEENIYLSSSCGLNNSSLDVHENVFLKKHDTSITMKDTEIPVWILNSETLKHEITMPPMSEGITFHKKDLYVLFESASTKYKFGKYLGFDHIFRY